MAGIAGLRGTGDWGTDERPKSFREKILWLDPHGDTPIFGLSSKAGKYPVKDPEYAWWAETQTLVRLQVNGALGAGDTTVVVDSADPTSSTMSVAYGTASHLKPGDLLLVEPAAASLGSFNPEIIRVISVISDTAFNVERGVGGTTAASIDNDVYLLLIGSSYAEGTGVPSAVSRNPIKFSNYTQIFKDSYELTGTADKTEARTGSPWSNDKKRKMFDHSRAIESTLLYQVTKNETTGSNGKPLRTTAGLRGFVPSANVTAYTVAVTTTTLLDALEPIYSFTGGGLGGDTRIGFGGNAALLEMGKIIKGDSDVTIELGEKIKLWGIDFRELIMPWGRLLLKSHPLLSRHPVFKKSIYIMDFGAVKWAPLTGRDTKTYDDVQNKDEDVRRGYVMTEGGWFVDGGGLTCGILDNVSAS
jgi:hypothetical protein